MAILGFSHITSEVSNLSKSIQFYRDNGFQLKFQLEMVVPSNKRMVLHHAAKKVKLAYLIYGKDEACNIELIEHDTQKNDIYNGNGKIHPCFFTLDVKSDIEIKDLDGNRINVYPNKGDKSKKAKNYIIQVNDLNKASRFYEDFFNMVTQEDEIVNDLRLDQGVGIRSLTFQRCLHPNWDGYLHFVENKDIDDKRKYLDYPGFHSFCFLVSNVEEDIYSKFEKSQVIGPIQEKKQIKDEIVGFEVGFIYDTSGFPIEYLLLV